MDRNRLKFAVGATVIDRINGRIPGRPHDRLLDRVPDADLDVLEICAGTGYLSRKLVCRNRRVRVRAIDLSPEMVRTGRNTLRSAGVHLRLEVGDATALPFAVGEFDVVLAAFGLHELSLEDRKRAVHEVRRVLRPSGSFLVADLDAPSKLKPIFELYLRLSHGPEADSVLGSGLATTIGARGFAIDCHESHRNSWFPFQLIVARRNG